MSQRIVIIGTGFAGVWSALSAQRLIDTQGRSAAIEITVIAPDPTLVIRPRLYEAKPSSMTFALEPLFESAGIKFIRGFVDQIEAAEHTLHFTSTESGKANISFDRLILAAGSDVIRPDSVAGLQEHAFDIDTLNAAVKLEAHLEKLATAPESDARNTIVVCGAGFTGIEIVTELPKRLAHMVTKPRLILVDSDEVLASRLGPGPRPIITQAIKELNIEVKLGSKVTAVDAQGVTLASGEHIASQTVIWTAGVRATPLARQISGNVDTLGRLYADKHLRVPSQKHIFATGDAAAAETDNEGHYTMMSCQHAIPLGRASGFNAAADLLGEPMVEYSQPEYICCLDLGAWGTVVTKGWEREVKITGELAKKVKQGINRELIYPPKSASQALELAQPLLQPSLDEVSARLLGTAM
ncbi:pyridine nucleotide-disulfide oxidoreductase family protein [Periconia macrospinosa]|uniref:Pyridine nucleotide-disulfide oxidoreductase family protein n=1 Tax=Periconia macrospinosa TaxID=97972 RepID=A0A2V1DBB2_9PLEO|nr:pyridine nucleotide-disulfide oxidoreductase family protein [Periconia macrospinosa]